MSDQRKLSSFHLFIVIALTVSLLMPTIAGSSSHQTAMLSLTNSDRHLQLTAVSAEHDHSHGKGETKGQDTHHAPAPSLTDHPHDHHAPANLPNGYFLTSSGPWNVGPPPSVILDRSFKIDRPPRA